LRQGRLAQRQLVADRDCGVMQSRDNFICRSLAILDPFVSKSWPAKIYRERVALQENYRFNSSVK